MAYRLRLRRKPARVRVPADLEKLKKVELVELAETLDVDASGTKADIIERLADG